MGEDAVQTRALDAARTGRLEFEPVATVDVKGVVATLDATTGIVENETVLAEALSWARFSAFVVLVALERVSQEIPVGFALDRGLLLLLLITVVVVVVLLLCHSREDEAREND